MYVREYVVRCKSRRKGEGQTDPRCVWLCGCCATNEESALLGWVLKLPGGLIAVENAAGEPIADVESRVVSMTGRWPTFPRDISASTLILVFQVLSGTYTNTQKANHDVQRRVYWLSAKKHRCLLYVANAAPFLRQVDELKDHVSIT